jgi:hypothetical protein
MKYSFREILSVPLFTIATMGCVGCDGSDPESDSSRKPSALFEADEIHGVYGYSVAYSIVKEQPSGRVIKDWRLLGMWKDVSVNRVYSAEKVQKAFKQPIDELYEKIDRTRSSADSKTLEWLEGVRQLDLGTCELTQIAPAYFECEWVGGQRVSFSAEKVIVHKASRVADANDHCFSFPIEMKGLLRVFGKLSNGKKVNDVLFKYETIHCASQVTEEGHEEAMEALSKQP